MRTSHTLHIVFLLCLILTACAPVAPVTPVVMPSALPSSTPTVTATVLPSVTPTLEPTASPTVTATATATVPPAPRLSAYTLSVALDYDQKSADVQEKIEYINTSTDTLNEVRLVIPPLAYPEAFSLKSLQGADGQEIKARNYESSWLAVPLSAALAPGATTQLTLNYHLGMPAATKITGSRPVPFGYTARQLNLVDWYPFIAPYVSGKGWLAHPFSAYGESMAYEMNRFDVQLTISSQKAVQVAASTAAEQNGQSYHYQMRAARTFALSISSQYQVEKFTLGNIEISSYYYPANAVSGKAAAQIAAQSIQLYGDHFALYPHRSLAVVEADFLDGMEYDGLIFVSKAMYNLYQGKSADYFTAIVTHETAHQWFYALIGNDQAEQPWLDEALATYCELLYDEKYAPDAAQWWWDVRVNYYHPSGWVDSSVYDQQGQGDSYALYRNAVYLNGATFLDELRKTVGDETFFAFLKDYTGQFSGKIVTSADFFTILQKHTSQDIHPLLKKYFSK